MYESQIQFQMYLRQYQWLFCSWRVTCVLVVSRAAATGRQHATRNVANIANNTMERPKNTIWTNNLPPRKLKITNNTDTFILKLRNTTGWLAYPSISTFPNAMYDTALFELCWAVMNILVP
jgi:hypothetical protein